MYVTAFAIPWYRFADSILCTVVFLYGYTLLHIYCNHFLIMKLMYPNIFGMYSHFNVLSKQSNTYVNSMHTAICSLLSVALYIASPYWMWYDRQHSVDVYLMGSTQHILSSLTQHKSFDKSPCSAGLLAHYSNKSHHCQALDTHPINNLCPCLDMK